MTTARDHAKDLNNILADFWILNTLPLCPEHPQNPYDNCLAKFEAYYGPTFIDSIPRVFFHKYFGPKGFFPTCVSQTDPDHCRFVDPNHRPVNLFHRDSMESEACEARVHLHLLHATRLFDSLHPTILY